MTSNRRPAPEGGGKHLGAGSRTSKVHFGRLLQAPLSSLSIQHSAADLPVHSNTACLTKHSARPRA